MIDQLSYINIYMDNIPDEVLTKILHQVDYNSIKNCFVTNKRLYLILNDIIFWKDYVNEKFNIGINLSEFKYYVENLGKDNAVFTYLIIKNILLNNASDYLYLYRIILKNRDDVYYYVKFLLDYTDHDPGVNNSISVYKGIDNGRKNIVEMMINHLEKNKRKVYYSSFLLTSIQKRKLEITELLLKLIIKKGVKLDRSWYDGLRPAIKTFEYAKLLTDYRKYVID